MSLWIIDPRAGVIHLHRLAVGKLALRAGGRAGAFRFLLLSGNKSREGEESKDRNCEISFHDVPPESNLSFAVGFGTALQGMQLQPVDGIRNPVSVEEP
jgi:hypothetical protein